MATDQTPPRNNLIFFYTVASVLSLVALVPVFKSYFHYENDQTVGLKNALYGGKELREYRRLEKHRLESAPIPIDRAMQSIAQHGRSAAIIAPQPSTDVAARQGWVQLAQPGQAAAPPPAAPPTEGGAAPPAAAPAEGATPQPGATPTEAGAAPQPSEPTEGHGAAQLAPTGRPSAPLPNAPPSPTTAGAH